MSRKTNRTLAACLNDSISAMVEAIDDMISALEKVRDAIRSP